MHRPLSLSACCCLALGCSVAQLDELTEPTSPVAAIGLTLLAFLVVSHGARRRCRNALRHLGRTAATCPSVSLLALPLGIFLYALVAVPSHSRCGVHRTTIEVNTVFADLKTRLDRAMLAEHGPSPLPSSHGDTRWFPDGAPGQEARALPARALQPEAQPRPPRLGRVEHPLRQRPGVDGRVAPLSRRERAARREAARVRVGRLAHGDDAPLLGAGAAPRPRRGLAALDGAAGRRAAVARPRAPGHPRSATGAAPAAAAAAGVAHGVAAPQAPRGLLEARRTRRRGVVVARRDAVRVPFRAATPAAGERLADSARHGPRHHPAVPEARSGLRRAHRRHAFAARAADRRRQRHAHRRAPRSRSARTARSARTRAAPALASRHTTGAAAPHPIAAAAGRRAGPVSPRCTRATRGPRATGTRRSGPITSAGNEEDRHQKDLAAHAPDQTPRRSPGQFGQLALTPPRRASAG